MSCSDVCLMCRRVSLQRKPCLTCTSCPLNQPCCLDLYQVGELVQNLPSNCFAMPPLIHKLEGASGWI